MKPLLLLLTILTFNSCGNSFEKHEESKISESKNVKLLESNKLKDRIIGEWSINYVADGLITKCNVCPKVKFNDSGVATFTKPSGDRELYNWNYSGGILKLQIIGEEKSNQYFPNSEYKTGFKVYEKFAELTLSLSETEKYILRK